MKMKWSILVCESCNCYFAIEEQLRDTSCPNCASEDVTETGEYLGNTLYTESGKVIQ